VSVSTETGRPSGVGIKRAASLKEARIAGNASGEKSMGGKKASAAFSSESMRCSLGISCLRRWVGVTPRGALNEGG
jgi:hypothetical protein